MRINTIDHNLQVLKNIFLVSSKATNGRLIKYDAGSMSGLPPGRLPIVGDGVFSTNSNDIPSRAYTLHQKCIFTDSGHNHLYF